MMPLLTSFVLFLASQASAQVIPGLAPVDVYLSLEKSDFTTQKNYGKEQHEFVCSLDAEGTSYRVTIYIPAGEITKVKVVSAVVTNTGNDESATNPDAADFLGYAATLNYDGAMPAEAKDWVEKNVGKTGSATFGPAKYELFANGRACVLRISPQTDFSPPPPPKPSASELRAAAARRESKPLVGVSYAECVKWNGEPRIKEPDTGWAWWAGFRAKFADGKVVETADVK